MKFTLDDDQAQVAALAKEILGDHTDFQHVQKIEAEGGFDSKLWKLLADAGLLGVGLPESVGGLDLGMQGVVALLEQQGHTVAPVPLWAATCLAALPLAEFGTAEQQERWLTPLLDGSHLVTGSFDAPGNDRAVLTATPSGDGWVLNGMLPKVPAAEHAVAMVVPAALPDGGIEVFVVPTDLVERAPAEVTNWQNTAAVTCTDVPVTAEHRLSAEGRSGADIVAWIRRRARVGLAGLALGICAEDVRRTAAYTSEREQFGRPLSTNQAVTFRMANAHLDTEMIRLTVLRAASLLDEGHEVEGDTASLVAKWWVAKATIAVVVNGQMLHGGLGGDVEYPIHRYFLWGRDAAYTLGSAPQIAAELGAVLGERNPRIGDAE